jgi:subtilisin family serine protease
MVCVVVASTTIVGQAAAEGDVKGAVLRGKGRGDVIPGRYIVVLKPWANIQGVAGRHGLAPDVSYDAALRGFAGTFASQRVLNLLKDPDVDWVEQDQVVTIGAQTLPEGVNRVDAEQNVTAIASGSAGVNVDIAIIDTGVDAKHSDLNVYRGVSYINGVKGGIDDNGHGTHCAGIAAARNNGLGVVGVAPGARLWSVKVLDRNGSGSMSNVIKGVDYVASNARSIEVANLSLGGGHSDALNAAIANAVARGVVVVVAAGNSGVDAAASSPANSPDVLCVSAVVDTDGKPGGLGGASGYGPDDTLATFSNVGAVVDLGAPGVSVYSTYRGNTYASMSGTSMASPHVAGAVGLYLATRVKPISAAGVAAVRSAILAASQPQGSAAGFTGDRDSFAEPMLDARNL